MQFYEPAPLDRVLSALHPIFAWLSRHFPGSFGAPIEAPPHPSAMLAEQNWLYRIIFPRFLGRVTVDEAALAGLKERSKSATLIYVTKGIGQLEYHYFNHLFLKEGLPLARFNNALALRRWMRWRAFWQTIIWQGNEIAGRGRSADFIGDGKLTQMVAEGSSALISIPKSSLADEGLFFTGPNQALGCLMDAQKQSERPVVIVPLDFLWSKRPSSASRSIIDIMFGEKDSPGKLRKMVLFWRNLRGRAQLSIAKPIDLQSFLKERSGEEDQHLASDLRTALMAELNTEHRTITGPAIRPRGWFIQEVTSDNDLDEYICRTAALHSKPADDLRDLALRYIKEIASDLDYTYIELLDHIMTRTFERLYDSLHIDTEGLKRAKELYAGGPVVFVPNHKSHMDYLLISYILYHNGMTVPHIAAGMNLSFWPIGKVFRHSGAFFIRRTFRDNPLYRAVLETYLRVLLKEGYCQEFFIEGGRSRTGKLSEPKLGMLSMLHRAAKDANISALNFIPVSITYDRVIEQKSYVRELEGAGKEKEHAGNLLGLTKFLRRQRHRYGSIYVRFGEPVAAANDWEKDGVIEEVALKICHQINRGTVATPASIAAAALLAPARRGVGIEEFRRNWELIIDILEEKGVNISERIKTSRGETMDEALSKLVSSRLITSRSDSVEPFFSISEEKRIGLAYFKNGVVHFLISAGVVAALLLKQSSLGIEPHEEDIIGDFEECKRLFSHEFRFSTRLPVKEHVHLVLECLCSRNAIGRIDATKLHTPKSGAWICELLSAQIRPFVECLWVAFRHVTEKMKGSQDERTLIGEVMKTGNDLLLLEKISYREAITKVGFENAMRTLVSYGLLSVESKLSGKKHIRSYIMSDDPAATDIFKATLEKMV